MMKESVDISHISMPAADTFSELVDRHPVVTHRFLSAFSEGRLTKAQIRFWAVQQFFFSVSLPDAFAALYARIPDRFWREKRNLVDLLQVEAWGSAATGRHSRHFQELCRFLQINADGLGDADAKPYTLLYVAKRLDLCLDPKRHLAQGLAAIGFGNEALNMHIFRAYLDGIHKVPGLEDCPTGYFDAHLRDEEEDSQLFLNLLGLIVTSPEECDLARKGLLELLDARVFFLDALWADVSLL